MNYHWNFSKNEKHIYLAFVWPYSKVFKRVLEACFIFCLDGSSLSKIHILNNIDNAMSKFYNNDFNVEGLWQQT